jgi:hypothetical protein
MYPDSHLAGPDWGIGKFNDLQGFGASVLDYADSLHVSAPVLEPDG